MRIGTRASALALAQAGTVAALLGDGAELVPVTTSGDRDRAGADKERWVKELELALLAGEIDLAVHSAKDVPSVLPDGLELAGAPARADPFDALCGAASLAALVEGARVGTASLRRAAQLRALREDLEVVVIHGNVDTRLHMLQAGEVDALVLAAAGLQRLGRADAIGCVLRELVPAPGQGTLALEARVGDERAALAAQAITDGAAWDALRAERALVALLEASCNTPLGAYAFRSADDRTSSDGRGRGPGGNRGAGDGGGDDDDGVGFVLRTFVGLPDGSAWLRDETPSAPSPEAAGALAAERLLAAGGGELLRRAEELAAT